VGGNSKKEVEVKRQESKKILNQPGLWEGDTDRDWKKPKVQKSKPSQKKKSPTSQKGGEKKRRGGRKIH